MNAPELNIYDPAMCCTTGVCGPEVDPALVRFASDLGWIEKQGASVHRYNLAQEPDAFAREHVVKQALQQEGEGALPLIVMEGKVVSRGRYPTRDELKVWVGLGEEDETLYTPAVSELVAIGAAIASNCEPCFKHHWAQARKLGVSTDDVGRAVMTARAVKETPAKAVLELAHRYLERDAGVSQQAQPENTAAGGCCGGGEPAPEPVSESGSGCC